MGIEGLRSLSHSELVDTTLYTTHVHRSSLSIPSQGSTVRLPGAPVLPDSLFYSPAERRLTAAVAPFLMSLLWPRSRLRFTSDWYCRLRERRLPC